MRIQAVGYPKGAVPRARVDVFVDDPAGVPGSETIFNAAIFENREGLGAGDFKQIRVVGVQKISFRGSPTIGTDVIAKAAGLSTDEFEREVANRLADAIEAVDAKTAVKVVGVP